MHIHENQIQLISSLQIYHLHFLKERLRGRANDLMQCKHLEWI